MKFVKVVQSIIGTAILSSIAIPFGSVGVFRFGIWHQVEGVVLALHVTSAAATLGLIALMFTGQRTRVTAALCTPAAAISMLLGIWSLLVSPFAKLPGLSLFGAIETGEGAIWYLDLSVLIAATTLLKGSRIWSHMLLIAVVAATGSIMALQLLAPVESSLVPYSYTDYLAFHGIFGIAILGFWPPRNITAWSRAARAIGMIVCCAAVALSRNTTAIVLVTVVGPAIWLVLRLMSQRLRDRQMRIACVTIVAGTMMAMTIAPFLSGHVTNKLDTRARLFGVAVAALYDHPLALLNGFGWGAVNDLNFQYLHIDTSAFLRPNTIVGPPGEMLHFHSHNTFLEAFISTGLLGLILSIALVAILPVATSSKRRIPVTVFAAVFAGTAAMWFQLAESLPIMAIAFAAIPRRGRGLRWPKFNGAARRPILSSFSVPLALIGSLQGTAGFVEWDVGRRGQTDPWSDTALSSAQCTSLLDDYGRGGRHLAYMVTNVSNRLTAIADAGLAVAPEAAAVLDKYICASDRWTDTPHLLQLAVASVSTRTDLAFKLWDPAYNSLRDRWLPDWDQKVRQILEAAPTRTDIARHYIYWRIAQGQLTAAIALSDTILAQRPNDPMGLWFKGLSVSRYPARQDEARQYLTDALRLGTYKMVDIDHAFLAALGIKVRPNGTPAE